MAAAVLRSQDGDTLAVDASRLAAVASWPPSLADRSVSAVARYLDPPAMAPVTFVGTSLRARIILAAAASPIALTATVFNETSQDQDTVELAAAG